MTRARADTPPDVHPSLSGLSKAIVDKLAKLGLARKFDLALHLPLRYDDETHLYPIKDAPAARDVLIEATVVEAVPTRSGFDRLSPNGF